MKVRLRFIVQDVATAQAERFRPVAGFDLDADDVYLDGPVCRRLAVIDFDDRGGLFSGAKFLPPPRNRKLGKYRADENDLADPAFLALSTFALVRRTLEMFEEEDTLGRAVRWAFEGRQLLILPRAGVGTKAFYERRSASLQFFHFPGSNADGAPRQIYTALSHDIVCHETAHAILDGIAPDLHDASTPQSLALHEALADLTALVMAFRSGALRKSVLERSGGEIADTSFSRIAEEFGRARDGRAVSLRSLRNQTTLDPADTSRDELGRPNFVLRHEHHRLSQVLSGALAELMFAMFAAEKRRQRAPGAASDLEVSGRALFIAGERFKRMVFRALDYLPPGEVSFVDYARALLASDQASYPAEGEVRAGLVAELLRRHIARDASYLAVETDFDHAACRDLDLDLLLASDWAAYDFAHRHREFFGIPPVIPFRVRPRSKVTKLYYVPKGKTRVTELIFKVSWDQQEANPAVAPLPPRRQITVGATLVLEWTSRRVRALLRSVAAGGGAEAAAQTQDRDRLLAAWAEAGRLQLHGPGGAARGPWIESTGDLMRLRGAASMLHVADPAAAEPFAPPAPAAPAVPSSPLPPRGVDAGAFFDLLESRRQSSPFAAPFPPKAPG